MPTRQCVGRSAVEQPTAGERRPLENDAAQGFEGEVVTDRPVGTGRTLLEQPVADRLVEGVRRLGIAAATHRAHEVGVEPTLQYCSRRHDLSRGLLDGVNAALEQITDAGGRTLNEPALRGADVLHDKERQAARLGEQSRRIELRR